MALKISKTVKEIEKDLGISSATIYRYLNRLGYTCEIIGRDPFATRAIYMLGSDAYVKEAAETNRTLVKLLSAKDQEITKLKAEISALQLQLITLPEFEL